MSTAKPNQLIDQTGIGPSQNTGGTGFATVPVGIPANRAPTSSDHAPQFTLWDYVISNTQQAVYMQTQKGQGSNWTLLGSGASGAVLSVTGDDSVVVLPTSGGTINLNGTANQILTTSSANGETFSLIGPYTPATYTAHGVLLGEGTSSIVATTAGTNGQVLLGSTGADPAFGTLTTSTGIGFTTGAHSLAINVKQNGFAINTASTGVTLAAQNVYTVTQSSQASFALPAVAAVGDTFIIASATGNTSGWIITQGASQEIWANTNHTTNGATGTLAGAIHCSVVLMCTEANNIFTVIGGSGLTGYTFT